MDLLGVDEAVPRCWCPRFSSLDEGRLVPKQEMLGVEELTKIWSRQLRSRARDVLLTKAIALEERLTWPSRQGPAGDGRDG